MDGDDSSASVNRHRVSSATDARRSSGRDLNRRHCRKRLDNSTGNGKKENRQAEGYPKTRSSSVQGNHHRPENATTVPRSDRICGRDGCEREAEVRRTSQEGMINRLCSEHKQPEVIATRIAHCEHPGCHRTSRYGSQGRLVFCKWHKRAGMYTVRGGMLFMATRDGKALRPPDDITEDSGAADGSRTVTTPDSEGLPVPHGHEEDLQTPSFAPGQTASLYPRLCESPGCQTRPSDSQAGTTGTRFCADHEREGMESVKKRICLHPRCTTRSHYGLSHEQAEYCSKHKTSGMVHILKEGLPTGKVEQLRHRDKTDIAPPGKKSCFLAVGLNEERHGGKRAKDIHDEEQRQGWVGADVHEWEEDVEENRKVEGEEEGNPRGLASKRKVMAAGKPSTKRNKITKLADSPAPSTSGSASSPTSEVVASPLSHKEAHIPGGPLSTQARTPAAPPKTLKNAETAGSTAPPPAPEEQSARRSRRGDLPGMTPSIELKIIQEARETALAAAEASGSGRRARAPSRKALEASGKLRNEGLQWLTREKKAEQAKINRQLKEERKVAAVAGLKFGHVIEMLAAPEAVASMAVDGGGVDIEDAVRPKISWRKLTLAETLQAAGGRRVVWGTAQTLEGGETSAASNGSTAARQESESADSAAAGQNAEESPRGQTLEAISAVGASSEPAVISEDRKPAYRTEPEGCARDKIEADATAGRRTNIKLVKRDSLSQTEDTSKRELTDKGGNIAGALPACKFRSCAKSATW